MKRSPGNRGFFYMIAEYERMVIHNMFVCLLIQEKLAEY